MFRLCASCNQAQSKSMKDVTPRTQGPEPSALHLAPRAFSVGAVDSFGGLVYSYRAYRN